MENALLRANTAATVRQKIQVHRCPEPYLAAMAATFSSLKHRAVPNDIC
jgi:hypothetical protein